MGVTVSSSWRNCPIQIRPESPIKRVSSLTDFFGQPYRIDYYMVLGWFANGCSSDDASGTSEVLLVAIVWQWWSQMVM